MASQASDGDIDKDDDNEQIAMLKEKRGLPNVRGKIEMSDGTDGHVKESCVRTNATKRYLALTALGAIVAVVFLAVILGIYGTSSSSTETDDFSNREKFMRLYEEIIQYGGIPELMTNSMNTRLPPQQLKMARLAGILPLENNSYPFNAPVLSDSTNPAPGFQNERNDKQCRIQCDKQDVSIPPLLIISLDGFAYNYLDRKLIPSLEAMAKCGARAKRLYPSYPSKTFPNHYTIATGLYPESHGIVDNSVYDPELSPKMEDMKRVNISGFYLGEPIWSLAVRQHRRMFCLFWPGCSFNITGYNPTVDIKYNRSMAYSARIDMILNWLLLPPPERPSLIMAYFDQPDLAGHFHTNDRQVNLELIYLESVLNYLFKSLYERRILDCTNVIILSDHGMQFLDKRIYLNEVLNTEGMITASGVIGRLHIANSNSSVDSLLDELRCLDVEHYSLYDRKRVPKRFHFAKSKRIGDIILNGKPGTIFFDSKKGDYGVKSDHGYDYLTESMHAIFFARGPNIQPRTVLEPFQNIELFNLFADLLRLDNDVPTNGTRGLLDSIYTNMNVHRENSMAGLKPVPECALSIMLEKDRLNSCFNSTECQKETAKANAWLNACSGTSPSSGIFYIDESSDACFLGLCTTSLLTTPSIEYGKPAIIHEVLTDSVLKTPVMHKSAHDQDCFEYETHLDKDCNNWRTTFAKKRDSTFVWQSLMAGFNDLNKEIADLNRLQFLMYQQFRDGPFFYLQNLTSHYVKRYKKVLVITGTIYDFNNDGLADDMATFWQHQQQGANLELLPTHFFRVLIRCEKNMWHLSGMSCRKVDATRIIAFVLPNTKDELNCLMPDDYLLINTAQIKDIELLTNVHFFSERQWYPEQDALNWRSNITTTLWLD